MIYMETTGAGIRSAIDGVVGEAAAGTRDVADTPSALQGFQVLDLTRTSAQYCGKLFAQLGAEVILIEPPGGSSTRRDGPFVGQEPHLERSMSFAYFNQSKKGICLDLEAPEGQVIFSRLAHQADLIIESEPPGVMQRRGLDYVALSRENPRLVMTSITPFGQDGPYAEHVAEDLTVQAMGGLLYLGGYPETEPVGAPGDQAYLAAAQFAAVASMTALSDVEMHDSIGQYIDVSMQECVVMALENSVQFVDLEATLRKRTGGHQRQAGTGVFPCKDGLIYLMAGGIASNRFWAATVAWLVEEGAPGAEQLSDPRWAEHSFLATDAAKQTFAAIFLPFAARHIKADLYREGQRRRIPICPISTTSDLLSNAQLAHRRYFGVTEHPYTGRVLTVPGAPYCLSLTPWRMGRPAPRLGEHNAETLSALGYDIQAQAVLLRQGVTG